MAIRTTAAAVAAIIEQDAKIDLTPFIEVASSMVDDLCTSSGYSDTKLELIERWLSAHFYAIRDPRAIESKAGTVGEQYESRVDLGLNQTRYGQQVMLLDYRGNLAALQKRISEGIGKPFFKWLGTDCPPC